MRSSLTPLALAALLLLRSAADALSTARSSVAILGASGYTGAELMRLLTGHPLADIKVLTADRSAGMDFAAIYPQFSYLKNIPKLTKVRNRFSRPFTHTLCARSQLTPAAVGGLGAGDQQVRRGLLLPAPRHHPRDHQVRNRQARLRLLYLLTYLTSRSQLAALSKTVKIVDLSADFRLSDVKSYETWYGKPHAAAELQKEAVYALPEINRAAIRGARIIANPGCYPTAAQLPLVPLLAAKLISHEDIIIDAKSGTTGAGRAPKEAFLYCEVADGIHAYGVASHRHSPEIEQVAVLASRPVF